MNRLALILVLAGTAFLAITGGAKATGTVSLLYVDTDITGNTATSLGPVDDCGTIPAVGGQLQVDVAIAEYPAGGSLKGYDLTVAYDPAVLEVTAKRGDLLLYSGGGSPLSAISEQTPDTDGSYYYMAEASLGSTVASAGVLIRLTFQAVGPGQSTITVGTGYAPVLTTEALGETVPVSQVNQGFIAVGGACVPSAQPGPPFPAPPARACIGGPDTDGDGFTDCEENFMGTLPYVNCATTLGGEQASQAWPVDPNGNRQVNLMDINRWGIHLPTWPPSYDRRYDLNTNGIIEMSDIERIDEHFGQTCTPVALPDADADGTPDSVDNCVQWTNPTQALPNWGIPAGDADCDGYPDSVKVGMHAGESVIGTDAALHCNATVTRNDEATDAWPPDMDDNQLVNLQDIGTFNPQVGARNGIDPRYTARNDLNADNLINLQDIGQLNLFFGKRCV